MKYNEMKYNENLKQPKETASDWSLDKSHNWI